MRAKKKGKLIMTQTSLKLNAQELNLLNYLLRKVRSEALETEENTTGFIHISLDIALQCDLDMQALKTLNEKIESEV